MSDLVLSDQIINELQAVLIKHDEYAGDSIRFAQYLSTISAVIIAEQTAPTPQLENLFSQLMAFTEHVFKQQMTEKSQTADQSEAVYGRWTPN